MCFSKFLSPEKEKHPNYLMKYTVVVPKQILINGVVYKYYIETEKIVQEYLPHDVYGGTQYRNLKLETSFLSERGN